MIDWNDAFDNSSYVPGADGLADRWANEARDWRAKVPFREIVYGTRPRNRIDLFSPKREARGVVVFVHGGYWQMLDKTYWSHLAAGAFARGWAFAVVGYTLTPDIRISEIVKEIEAAVKATANEVDGPVRLIGHSAGGHLVARLACSDGPLPERIDRVVPISGIHDLRPLLLTEMNTVLRLDQEEARAQSPALLDKREGLNVICWVGANERPELVRQTRLLSAAWGIPNVFDAGQDHFSVIEQLADPHSPLISALLED